MKKSIWKDEFVRAFDEMGRGDNFSFKGREALFEYLENYGISQKIDYLSIEGVSIEAREKLNKIQPVSLGQAVRVPGVNYTDVQAIMIYLKKNHSVKDQ